MRRDDGSDIDIAFHEAHLTLRDGTPVLIRRLLTEDAPSRFSEPRESRGSSAALLRTHARGEPHELLDKSSTTIRPVPRTSIRSPSLFYHTDRPSWTGRMLRQTCAKSVMRSSRAAISDKSIILSPTNGPRSVIRMTTERPFS
jgi:hypothetical protein